MSNPLTNEDVQLLEDLTNNYAENLTAYTTELVDAINAEKFEEASFYRDRIANITKQAVLILVAITGKSEELVNAAFEKEQELVFNEITKEKNK